MNDWISVKKDIPKIGKQVLFIYEHQDMYCGWVSYVASRGVKEFYHNMSVSQDSCMVENVTHWMELPELPRE